MDQPQALTVSELCVQHGREVTLRYPDLHLPAGTQLAVTGPSGTGKTTLLHVLAGLLTPLSGQVQHGDFDLTRASAPRRDQFRRRAVGYVFQDFHLMPGLTAQENVELGVRVTGLKRPGALAEQALTQLGLGHRRHHRPHQLSTGERQRVALARAVAHRPGLLLADEPTAHLDRDRAASAASLLLGTAAELGATLILVTHDPQVAALLPGRLDLTQVGGA
ncbi:ATP-binding cassette domain-containing protein [Deinococcus sp. HMF7620]|uniref:ATP-binding cassette domain-containing protein n=1 Tax=Deinococcus arboris TaxID=2682977 RepID=A0A7C9LLA5_9DEIO|nr:ABC transporter ATP-binding protein [Deinococcus arboris]MVN86417.1 ATP-binding cassette domain-containing protein [Deinococcus arboris]